MPYRFLNIQWVFYCLGFIFCSFLLNAQLTGKITKENSELLHFASIYVKGTSKGTTSNAGGEYFLELQPGEYTIVFQYVGFQTQTHEIRISEDEYSLDVTMKQEAYRLSEVTIQAQAEDPAYAIIRKAIEKRKYYLSNVDHYHCDVYIKGNHKLLKAPEKVFGQKVGDLEGILDSNRQGIVYLSESLAKYYFQAPDKRKEIMISSKISGDDRGYSFNNATEMEINFYENTLELNRQLVSPIADNALSYYRYKLIGAQMDEEGRLINKIQVIPRRKYDPVVSGTIYIVEELWNIQSVDLRAGPEATQLYFMDSITVRQVHITVGEEDQWMVFSNYISFGLSLFGFELFGQFTGVYTNYDLTTEIDPSIFNSDLLVVREESNQRDESYWQRIRPVPLLQEEVRDYYRRDSIHEVRDRPEFKDSLDRLDNRFHYGDLLGTYEYRKRRKQLFIDIESPVSNTAFHTVKGFHMTLRGRFLKYYDEEETNRILFWPSLNYGFSEEIFRPKFQFEYRMDRLHSSLIGFELGRETPQFNDDQPVSEAWNTIYSLFFRKNYMKIYDKKLFRIYGRREVSSGFFLTTSIEYSLRNSLDNFSDYSFFYEDTRTYESNNPLEDLGIKPFSAHEAFIFESNLRFRIGQKYYKYPDRKFAVENNNPTLTLNYRLGLPWLESDVSFHHLEIGIEDQFDFGVGGDLLYFLNAGTFAGNDLELDDQIYFADYKHFAGQQILFGNPADYVKRYLLLPYYARSSKMLYFQAHWEHHFNGWILDKIPLVNSLGLRLVAGGNYLYVRDQPHYGEIYVGLDQVGFSFLRLLRVDFVFGLNRSDEIDDFGFRIGFAL